MKPVAQNPVALNPGVLNHTVLKPGVLNHSALNPGVLNPIQPSACPAISVEISARRLDGSPTSRRDAIVWLQSIGAPAKLREHTS